VLYLLVKRACAGLKRFSGKSPRRRAELRRLRAGRKAARRSDWRRCGGFIQFNPVFGAKDANLDRVASSSTDQGRPRRVARALCYGYTFESREELLEAPRIRGRTFSCCLPSRANRGTIVAGIAEREGDACYNSASCSRRRVVGLTEATPLRPGEGPVHPRRPRLHRCRRPGARIG